MIEYPSKLRSPWLIFVVGALFYLYVYFLRIVPEALGPLLNAGYHANILQIESITSVYYWAYVPMQFLVGVLIDRLGPRLLGFACLACALGNYLFVSFHDPFIAEMGRLMVGFGSAFAFVGSLMLAAKWLDHRIFACITGLLLSFGMMGAGFGLFIFSELSERYGHLNGVLFTSSVGIGLSLLIWLVIPSNRRQSSAPQAISWKVLGPEIKKLFTNRAVWLNALIGGLLFLPLVGFADIWALPYLKIAFGLTHVEATELLMMVFLGLAAGAPLIGWFSDRIQQRRLFLTIGSVFSAISLSMVLYMPNLSQLSLVFLLFGCGVSVSCQLVVFPYAIELTSKSTTATAISFTNAVVMLMGLIVQAIIGHYLLEHPQLATAPLGLEDFQRIFIILPLALILAVFLTFFLPETNGENVCES